LPVELEAKGLMCGLLAIYDPRAVATRAADGALALLAHRGPDARAVWTNSEGTLALGHARLKILDLRDVANQPMQSPDGRYVFIFNGEIVNFRALRAAYRGPWTFRTSGDTEIFLASLAAGGTDALHDAAGMFAFVLFDREQQTLQFVRDRFGIKPLYITRLPDGGFAVASEIPPLLKLRGSAEPDCDVIRTYLETGLYDFGQRTFFAGIESLPPGCEGILNMRDGTFRVSRWYDLARAVRPNVGQTRKELVEQGRSLVRTAVRDHLVSDVAVGLNVSGGVDSSVLVRAALEVQTELHVFTQDFEPPYSEFDWVKKVSNGTTLHRCALSSEDIRAVLDETVKAQAEPFGGVTVAGYDALYRSAAEEGITVLLDGNGVDEVFLGYDKYKVPQAGAGRSIDGSSGLSPDAIGPLLRERAQCLSGDNISVGGGDPARLEATRDLLSEKIPRGLRFNDRMSMKRSRELRVPFLDHRIVEFGFGVPTSEHLCGGHTKSLFREIAETFVPQDLAWAKKRSVQSPQREWLADDWRGLVEGIIESRSFRERGWIDTDVARERYREYREGKKDNSFFVWQWINLELWARAFLDVWPA
jgi:asparagine synthase (glutamine-hydrolysing)